MKPTRFPLFTSFLFPPIILLFLLTSSLSTDYHYPQNCQPKSCGGLANVTFPFWIRGLQPDYCGYPPFELRCEEDNLKLFMADEDYRVLDISYENQTSTVSISNFSSMDSSCLLPYNNLSFALTPFVISSLNRELVIVHNCSAKMNGAVEISCHDQRNYAYLGGQYRYQNPESKGTLGSCFSTVVPVWGSNGGADAGKYQELLGGGFLLNWTAPECWDCRGSGGQCGYNNNTGGFMCICHDRAHWKSCFFSSPESSSAVVEGKRSKIIQMDCGLVLIAAARMVSVVFILVLALPVLGACTVVLLHVINVSKACRRANAAVNTGRGFLSPGDGLSALDIEKLPCFEILAPAEEGGEEGTCVVCLESFRLGDRCRLLPVCRHSFHAQCVDCWLVRSCFCPICRSSAVCRRGAVEVGRGSESSSILAVL